jgi:hypothetical protein
VLACPAHEAQSLGGIQPAANKEMSLCVSACRQLTVLSISTPVGYVESPTPYYIQTAQPLETLLLLKFVPVFTVKELFFIQRIYNAVALYANFK